ncbi:MAG: DUF3343 domain-containing protein [Ruminococcaceae bacterium]|nr:DUF3343 domain-containing protein [Oscillospiraceae bacterium]
MSEFIATFHTHLSALLSCQSLTALGAEAQMMPVPRALSSSCGTCVRYRDHESHLEAMDEDVEAVYEVCGGEYRLLMEKE